MCRCILAQCVFTAQKDISNRFRRSTDLVHDYDRQLSLGVVL